MDINKIEQKANNQFQKTDKTSESPKKSDISSRQKSSGIPNDEVLISDYKFRNNDQLFAKLELEKHNASASDKFSDIKTKVAAYQEAQNNPNKDVQNTELGQKVNDPDVWGDIAEKILR